MSKRDRHACIDIQSEVTAHIDTDHIPLILKLQNGITPPTHISRPQSKPYILPCNEEERSRYTSYLWDTHPTSWTYEHLLTTVFPDVENLLPLKNARNKPSYCSNEANCLIEEIKQLKQSSADNPQQKRTNRKK